MTLRRVPHVLRVAGMALLAGSLVHCASRTPPTHRDVAALAACRQRADEVYQKQNRAELYRSDEFATSSRDAPFASTGLPGITTRGLSGEYARDVLVDDCLNASGAPQGAKLSPANASGGASPEATPPSQLP